MNPEQVRRSLADAIEEYLDGRITNEQLDVVIGSRDASKDRTCIEIGTEMQFFLSDFTYHRNEGKYHIENPVEQALRRWITLLRYGWLWNPERSDTTRFGLRGIIDLLRANLCIRSRLDGNLFWPLENEQEWNTFQQNLAEVLRGKDVDTKDDTDR